MMTFKAREHKRRVDLPPDVLQCNSCGVYFADEESYDAHVMLDSHGFAMACAVGIELDDEGLVKLPNGTFVLYE